MSGVVSLASARQAGGPRLRIGLLRLTDGAPVMVANEFGFFAEEDVEVALSVEPSWANIADKLTYGFLDAAVIVPPLAFAVHLGLRGVARPLVIPYGISAGGNSVTLNKALAEESWNRARGSDIPVAEALAGLLRQRRTTLAVVHAYSTHALLLRYWLATAGIVAGRDVTLTVVPPARAAEALESGQIDGFCAGAPWGEVARRAGAGGIAATSRDIWRHAPEKALAVRADWAAANPDALAGAMRALLRAARFCDGPENAEYTASLLSRRRYVAADPHAILADLPGGAPDAGPDIGKGCIFHRGATNFPWRSHGLWFLDQMRRWGLVDASLDLRGLAGQVYRPDLYRAAVRPLGEPVPAEDWKREGAHEAAWSLDAGGATLAMRADYFCDHAVFDPDAPPSAVEADSAEDGGVMHKN